MEIKSAADLFYIVAVFVPGFIYNAVLLNFVPLRQNKETELILLRFLTITAISYAVSSPLIYLLIFKQFCQYQPVLQAFLWFFIIFLVPIILALIHAKIIQKDGLGWLYRWLDLRPINPVPTGWDWIFSRTSPCYLLVTLTDGTEIAGYFGTQSMASSDPERRDIYLEMVYTIPEDGGPWQEVDRSLGMYIANTQISSIEFRKA